MGRLIDGIVECLRLEAWITAKRSKHHYHWEDEIVSLTDSEGIEQVMGSYKTVRPKYAKAAAFLRDHIMPFLAHDILTDRHPTYNSGQGRSALDNGVTNMATITMRDGTQYSITVTSHGKSRAFSRLHELEADL